MLGVAVGEPVGLDVGLVEWVGVDVGLVEWVGVGVGFGEPVEVAVGVGVGDGWTAAQVDLVMVLVSSVTAPSRARRRPWKTAPVCAVTDVWDSTSPTKWVPVPKVAELPTCQTTLHACAPLMRRTALFDAVIRVEPAWKMNWASGSPPAFRVRVPVRPRVGLL